MKAKHVQNIVVLYVVVSFPGSNHTQEPGNETMFLTAVSSEELEINCKQWPIFKT